MEQQQSSNFASYPLKDIPHPHPHDVLCGRGGGSNNHVGNSHWRMLVAANKQLYITLPKRQKMLLSRSIVNAVRSQNPPGRFLQKDSKSNLWFDVGDQRAQEKTSQALREGAPDIRNKLAQQKTKKPDEVDSTAASMDDPGDDDEEEASAAPAPPAPKSADDVSTSSVATSAPTAAEQQASTSTAMETQPTSSSSSSSNKNPAPAPAAAQKKQQQQQQQPQPPQQKQQQQQQQPPKPQAPNMQMPHPGMPGMPGMPPNMQHPHGGMMPPFMQMPNGGMFPGNGTMMPSMANSQHMQVVTGPGGQPMMYYAGPNMTPMPVYPTMVLNDQGMMVPAMSFMPPMMPPMIPPQGPNAQTSGSGSAVTGPSSNGNNNGNNMAPPTSQQQSQQKSSNSTQRTEASTTAKEDESDDNFEPLDHTQEPLSFEEYAAMLPPGALDPAGLSFGSITMTDAEQRKLETTGTSFGSAMSFTTRPLHAHNNKQQYDGKAPGDAQFDGVPAPDAMGGLEPSGISFGSVSMMSVGDGRKLEATGTSFGSMMSYNTIRADAVEGGLEAIGTSFGSLSIDTTSKDKLFHSLEIAAAGANVPPIFQQQRSTGNLLECSDTDSDDEDSKPQLSAQKSAAWEKLQASVALQQQKSTDEIPQPTGGGMPPGVVGNHPSFLNVPTPTFDRDFSNLSAFSMGDEFHDFHDGENGGTGNGDAAAMPPPPPMAKQGSDSDKLEMLLLQRGPSLADDFDEDNAG